MKANLVLATRSRARGLHVTTTTKPFIRFPSRTIASSCPWTDPSGGDRLSDSDRALRILPPGFAEPVIGPATSGRTRWFNPGYKQTIKGSGTPVDADPYPPHPAVRLAQRRQVYAVCAHKIHARRARLPAFHSRLSPKGLSSQRLSVRPCFLGRGRSVRSFDRPSGRGAHAAPRALPAPRLSQSSEAPHAPVIVPAG